jgi:hypothetical protein
MFRTSRVYDSTHSETLPSQRARQVCICQRRRRASSRSRHYFDPITTEISTTSRAGTSTSVIGSYYNCMFAGPSCSTCFSYASSIRLNV